MSEDKYNYTFLWRQPDWGLYKRRNESFAWGLAKRDKTSKVLHIEIMTSKALLKTSLGVFFKKQIRNSLLLHIKKTFSLSPIKVDKNVYVKSLFSLVMPSNTLLGRVSATMIKWQFKFSPLLPKNKAIYIIYPPSPLAEIALNLHAPNLVVADLVDDVIARTTNSKVQPSRQNYELLLPRADWIISTGEALKKYEPLAGKSIEVLPNGVDTEEFVKSEKNLKKNLVPKIGYVGSLNRTMNWELVEALLYACADVNFIFAGFYDSGGKKHIKKFSAFSNFKFIGELHYSQVPKFLLSCDALINIKKTDKSTRGNNSLKIYQYLATGLPIISTSVPPANQFPGLIEVHDESQAFIEALKNVIYKDKNANKIKRMEAAKQHSWEQKVEYFEQTVNRMMEGS